MKDGASNDFKKDDIGKDMAIIAKTALERCGKDDIPVIYGGWSSGAVQAVPAAAYKNRPKSLTGLMMFGADSRGRYGLRDSDLIGKTPTGPGTFGLAEFTKDVAKLRVVQFHGGADFMASASWIRTLKSPHAVASNLPSARQASPRTPEGWRKALRTCPMRVPLPMCWFPRYKATTSSGRTARLHSWQPA